MNPGAHDSEAEPSSLKQVGKSGQISVGRRHAGRILRAVYREDGAIVLEPVIAVPENQLWTTRDPARSSIDRGLRWAATHLPAETNLEKLVRKIPLIKFPQIRFASP